MADKLEDNIQAFYWDIPPFTGIVESYNESEWVTARGDDLPFKITGAKNVSATIIGRAECDTSWDGIEIEVQLKIDKSWKDAYLYSIKGIKSKETTLFGNALSHISVEGKNSIENARVRVKNPGSYEVSVYFSGNIYFIVSMNDMQIR